MSYGTPSDYERWIGNNRGRPFFWRVYWATVYPPLYDIYGERTRVIPVTPPGRVGSFSSSFSRSFNGGGPA